MIILWNPKGPIVNVSVASCTTVYDFYSGITIVAHIFQVKSSHLYLYSAFNNTDCVKALNSIKLEDRVSVMYNNKIKHSIFS